MNNMERYITIKNYRNIGFDKEEKLVLNHSIIKKELGDLVVLIGPNNSGKSNVLDAIKLSTNNEFSPRDVSTFVFDGETPTPVIELVCKDGENYYRSIYEYKSGRTEIMPKIENDSLTLTEVLDAINEIYQKLTNIFGNHSLLNDVERIRQEIQNLNKPTDDVLVSIKNLINRFRDEMRNCGYSQVYKDFKENNYKLCGLIGDITSGTMDSYYRTKYGYNFYPNVNRYVEKNINNKEFKTTIDELKDSKFFNSVFKAIDFDIKKVFDAYEKYNKHNQIAFLEDIEEEINNKIKELDKKFNTLYFIDKVKYAFKVKLETTGILFSMKRGRTPIVFEYQSTGFKWFFNLYFNFLCSKELNAGDIIIMDEPATNLHPQGQQELRKFMKEFAIKNALTIVIATHSPFLIDVDNFDELRVVSIENNVSKIDNLFTTVNDQDPDSLLPIKESLTIKQHILYDYDMNVVFVEGITDYNYLTMFKKILKQENIAFLPIMGVGKNKQEQEAILSKLIKIRKHNGFLLVDGDKAGQEMKKLSEGTALDTICLTEVDEKFKEIEYLFSDEDRKKFNLNEKSAGFSSLIKNQYSDLDFSKETINNFSKLFDAIINR